MPYLVAMHNMDVADDVNFPPHSRCNEEAELQVAEIGMLGSCSGRSPSEGQPLLGGLESQRPARRRLFGRVQRTDTEYLGRKMPWLGIAGRRSRGRAEEI